MHPGTKKQAIRRWEFTLVLWVRIAANTRILRAVPRKEWCQCDATRRCCSAILSSQSRDQLPSGLPAAQFPIHLAVALANEATLQFSNRTAVGCDLEGSVDDAHFIHGWLPDVAFAARTSQLENGLNWTRPRRLPGHRNVCNAPVAVSFGSKAGDHRRTAR